MLSAQSFAAASCRLVVPHSRKLFSGHIFTHSIGPGERRYFGKFGRTRYIILLHRPIDRWYDEAVTRLSGRLLSSLVQEPAYCMAINADEPSGRSKGIKIGLAVVLLAAAGLIALSQRDSKVEQPDTPDTATTYVCLECGHAEELTAAAYADRVVSEREDRAKAGSAGEASRLKCPGCKKLAVVMGGRCAKDGTPVPQQGKDGRPGRCSKCGKPLFGN